MLLFFCPPGPPAPQQEQQSMQRGLAALLGSLSVLEGEEGAAREALCNVLNAEIRTRYMWVRGQILRIITVGLIDW